MKLRREAAGLAPGTLALVLWTFFSASDLIVNEFCSQQWRRRPRRSRRRARPGFGQLGRLGAAFADKRRRSLLSQPRTIIPPPQPPQCLRSPPVSADIAGQQCLPWPWPPPQHTPSCSSFVQSSPSPGRHSTLGESVQLGWCWCS